MFARLRDLERRVERLEQAAYLEPAGASRIWGPHVWASTVIFRILDHLGVELISEPARFVLRKKPE